MVDVSRADHARIAESYGGKSWKVEDPAELGKVIAQAAGHGGPALVDVISPCVTFNDHNGSTKSYMYTRKHAHRATEASFVAPQAEILANITASGTTAVTMHDGSVVNFTAVPKDYDPTDREKVHKYVQEHAGENPTGLLFLDENVPDLHEMNNTPAAPLARMAYEKLCPGSAALDALQEDFR